MEIAKPGSMNMKKHLIMIVGGYYPSPSATGRCAEDNIQLIQEQYDIDVICLSRTDNLEYEYSGKKVFPVGNRYTHLQHELRSNRKKILYRILKAPVYMMDCCRNPNNLHWYVKAAYKKLEAIHSEKPIDVIFSVGAPMASHCAAKRFKSVHPEVRWVTYSVDSYAAQNKNRQRFIKFEKSVLAKSDYNLLSEEIFNNSRFLYAEYQERVGTLPYLLPVAKHKVSQNHYFDTTKINLVYAGSFYKNIRNPAFLLNTFMQTKDEAVLHLFCSSDCDDLIDQLVVKSHGRIVRHGMVGADEIAVVYSEADVLVSVGNSLAEFKPSKTFEYIAMGKPILNIYYSGLKDDVLEHYPLSLQICNLEEVKSATAKMDEFILNCAGKKVSEEAIKSEFKKYMPENIRTIMLNALRG